ncbi:phosphoribosylamine--glycine ligase [Candidatus Fermentibacteria bacterium]|nr:phosphoribosylamine--glycine ligase [Candidatus Fermentibacteria bacterium]
MRLLVLGSGGREHVLAWKLAESPGAEVFVAPGNGGTLHNVSLNPSDFPAVEDFCSRERIDLLVVGPEAPLTAGISDHLEGSPVRVFGPRSDGARLEGSKIWAKQFMERHGVSTARFWAFDPGDDPGPVIHALRGDLVVKLDGLAAGKGVIVCTAEDQAWKALEDFRRSFGDAPFLIEQRLTGREASIIGITDGSTIRLLQASQDHKRAHEGERGPNTGGMGAYAPARFCDRRLMGLIHRRVIAPTLEGLRREGIPYCGAIYFGLMITPDGPFLLEYNVRFGDPEAQVILPPLAGDLAVLMAACVDGRLRETSVAFHPGCHVGVVMASKGYPGACETGFRITGLDKVPPDVRVFHAGTRRSREGVETAGGRVLTVVGHHARLEGAMAQAYRGVENIGFEGAWFRRDIGTQGRA